MDKHPSTFADILEPTAPERTNSLTHGIPPAATSRVNSVPEPATATFDATSNEKASCHFQIQLLDPHLLHMKSSPASAAASSHLHLTRVPHL